MLGSSVCTDVEKSPTKLPKFSTARADFGAALLSPSSSPVQRNGRLVRTPPCVPSNVTQRCFLPVRVVQPLPGFCSAIDEGFVLCLDSYCLSEMLTKQRGLSFSFCIWILATQVSTRHSPPLPQRKADMAVTAAGTVTAVRRKRKENSKITLGSASQGLQIHFYATHIWVRSSHRLSLWNTSPPRTSLQVLSSSLTFHTQVLSLIIYLMFRKEIPEHP